MCSQGVTEGRRKHGGQCVRAVSLTWGQAAGGGWGRTEPSRSSRSWWDRSHPPPCNPESASDTTTADGWDEPLTLKHKMWQFWRILTFTVRKFPSPAFRSYVTTPQLKMRQICGRPNRRTSVSMKNTHTHLKGHANKTRRLYSRDFTRPCSDDVTADF